MHLCNYNIYIYTYWLNQPINFYNELTVDIQVGKQFDALVIDTKASENFDIFPDDDFKVLLTIIIILIIYYTGYIKQVFISW